MPYLVDVVAAAASSQGKAAAEAWCVVGTHAAGQITTGIGFLFGWCHQYYNKSSVMVLFLEADAEERRMDRRADSNTL